MNRLAGTDSSSHATCLYADHVFWLGAPGAPGHKFHRRVPELCRNHPSKGCQPVGNKTTPSVEAHGFDADKNNGAGPQAGSEPKRSSHASSCRRPAASRPPNTIMRRCAGSKRWANPPSSASGCCAHAASSRSGSSSCGCCRLTELERAVSGELSAVSPASG